MAIITLAGHTARGGAQKRNLRTTTGGTRVWRLIRGGSSVGSVQGTQPAPDGKTRSRRNELNGGWRVRRKTTAQPHVAQAGSTGLWAFSANRNGSASRAHADDDASSGSALKPRHGFAGNEYTACTKHNRFPSRLPTRSHHRPGGESSAARRRRAPRTASEPGSVNNTAQRVAEDGPATPRRSKPRRRVAKPNRSHRAASQQSIAAGNTGHACC